jgi:hypothetical protein
MFTSEEIAAELTRIERELNEMNEDILDEDDLLRESRSRSPNELVSSQRSRNC